MLVTYGPRRENMSLVFSKNKGLDQPAHPCSPIGAFVIRLFEGIISKHFTSEISIVQLVYVAEQACLSMTWSETLKMFSCVRGRTILAHRIRISEILPWDRKSYLTHAILPRTSSNVIM